MFRSLLSIILIITLLASCSMEKRRYSSGFHIEWKKNRSHQSVILSSEKTATRRTDPAETVETSKNDPQKPEEAITDKNTDKFISTENNNSLSLGLKDFKHKVYTDTPGQKEYDEIILKTAEEIKAKVTEITPEEIKYKRFDNLNGPTYVIKRSDVFFIKYANGTKEIISPVSTGKSESSPSTAKPGNRTVVGYGIMGIFSAIVGLFVAGLLFGALAVVLGALGLSKINKEPEKYSGRGFAVIAILLGLANIVIILLAMAMLF